MPIYEFRCDACGTRFESLVSVGTEAAPCRGCGAAGARRVLSEPAPPFKLVRTPGGYRRQDDKNRRLREKTKRDFKQKMARGRAAAAAKARKGGPRG